MAASFTTCCVSWRRKLRQAFVLTVGAGLGLALAACSAETKEDDGSNKGPMPSSLPGSFELASSKPPPAANPGGLVLGVDAAGLSRLIEKADIRLIDVRTPEEHAAGFIEGSELVPLDQFDPAQLDLSDDRPIILYCRSGRRSEIAARRLGQHTGEATMHLSGGILGWQEAGFPITRN